MGTYNSGCAKIEVPVLNQDSDGPMLMVSHANTNPGLTKTWDAGRARQVLPGGKRNYARVVTTDDIPGPRRPPVRGQGPRVKKCYVLNDNETYGQGVADRPSPTEAKKQGIQILGNDPWDPKQPNYTALFQTGQGLRRRLRLHRRHLRQQRRPARQGQGRRPRRQRQVKLIGPDGFTGYPDS